MKSRGISVNSVMCWSVFNNQLYLRASLVAQLVKNLPAKQETWVQSLGWEDPLEEGEAAHSSVVARIIPWTEQD